jgi:hypothetical protein
MGSSCTCSWWVVRGGEGWRGGGSWGVWIGGHVHDGVRELRVRNGCLIPWGSAARRLPEGTWVPLVQGVCLVKYYYILPVPACACLA